MPVLEKQDLRERLLQLILQQRGNGERPAELPLLQRRTPPPISWAGEERRPTIQPKYQVTPAPPMPGMQVSMPRTAPGMPGIAPRMTTVARGAPEIAAPQEYAKPTWYQTALGKVAAPFEWLEEKVEEPVVRAVLGKTKEEYEKWQEEHKLLAGISEFLVTLPLFLIPIGGLISKAGGAMIKAATAAKMANTAQAVQSAVDFSTAVGKVLNWPLEVVGKGVKGALTTKPVRLTVNQSDEFVRFAGLDLKTVGQLAEEASPVVLRDAWSKIPGFEWVIRKIDPSLLAKTPEAKLTLGYMRYLHQSQQASHFSALPFGQHKKARELFGFIDDTQRATKLVPKGVGKGFEQNIENVLAHPEKFHLTGEQGEWLKTYKQLGDDVTDLLQREKIFPEDMLYDYGEDGAHFWRVLKEYKDPTGKMIEAKRTSMFTRGLHPKAKPRVIANYEGALKGGYRYLDPEQALFTRASQALEAVGYKDFLNNVIKLKGVRLPSEKAVKEILARNEFAKELRKIKYVGERLGGFALGKRLTQSQIKLLEERRPGLAQIIREMEPGMPSLDLSAVQEAVAKEVEVGEKMLTNLAQKAEIAKGRSLKEASLWQPGIANRIMPRETVEHIARTIGPVGDKWLQIMSDVQGVTRMFQTGVDMGPLFIQGLPTAFSNPKAWGAILKPSIGGLFDEKVFFKSLNTPRMQAVLKQAIEEGFTLNSAEFVEAAPLLEKMIGGAPGKFFGHWGRWFNFSVDYGRLIEAEALLMHPGIQAMGREGVKAVVDHLGKKWGVMSTQWIGVPAGQRMAENAILFYSSRFTRSAFAMAKDVFRGELSGALARDMMAKFLFGMTVTYYGLSKALDQEPNLDPSSGKFMTVKIGDEHIGFGGSYIAIMRLLGNVASTAAEEPSKFLSTSTRDQPFLRFFKSRLAPMTGMGIDILTGKTFIGEPLDTPLKKAEYAAIHGLMPFWLQSYVEGLVGLEPYINPAQAMPPEFFGMRAWPTRLWERRDDMREHYARLEHGKKWLELTVVQRGELEKEHADLKSITEEAWRDSLEKAIPSRAAYSFWREEHDQINQEYETALWDLQRQVDEGIKTAYDFRESYQKLALARRFALDHIDKKPEYADVIAGLNEPRLEPEILPQFEDLAYEIYVKLMYSGDLEKGVDDYDYEEADRRREWFISTYGQNAYDYVGQRLAQGKNIPPLMQEYYEAQEVLKPYWEVQSDADRYFGEMDSSNKQAFISRRRKALRTLNPQIARYYSLFYQRSSQ